MEKNEIDFLLNFCGTKEMEKYGFEELLEVKFSSRGQLTSLRNLMFYPSYQYSRITSGFDKIGSLEKIASLVAFFSAAEVSCEVPKISYCKIYRTINEL